MSTPPKRTIIASSPKPNPLASSNEVPGALPVEEPKTDVGIDELLSRGLKIIERTMRVIHMNSGSPSRNDIMNLKDCMSMLQDLKENEKDLIDEMSEEELAKIVAKPSKPE